MKNKMWFVMDGSETALPNTSYHGENAEAEARADAALQNAAPPYLGLKLTYKAVPFKDAVYMVCRNYDDYQHLLGRS